MRSSFWITSCDLLYACSNSVQPAQFPATTWQAGSRAACPGLNIPKHLFFKGWVRGMEDFTWSFLILHPAALCQLHCCRLLGLLQLLVLAPSSSYLHTVLCVPNPSIVLLISLLSKDTVSVHVFLEMPLKVWLGELMDPPSVSTLQSKETQSRHKSQAWDTTGVSPSPV